MKRALLSALICGSLVGAVAGPLGCNNDHSAASRGDSSTGATAVVDLDRVARDLGWMSKMESNLQVYKGQLQADVKKYDAMYAAEINQRVKDMTPPGLSKDQKFTLSPAKSQELSNLVAAGRQQIGEIARAGDQQFSRYRVEWIKQYRDALAPIIRQVAEEKKMNIVLQQGENVLFADRSVDLTDAVVDAARAKPPALTEMPMTHLEAPAEINETAPPAVGQSATKPATTQP